MVARPNIPGATGVMSQTAAAQGPRPLLGRWYREVCVWRGHHGKQEEFPTDRAQSCASVHLSKIPKASGNLEDNGTYTTTD
jgi:hypothetical protein